MNLESLIASPNSLRILKVLARQHAPISLRQLARTAQLPTSSTELVMRKILSSKIVDQKKVKNRTVFFLSTNSPLTGSLLSILDILNEHPRIESLKTLSERAQSSIRFIDEANKMVAIARRSLKSKTDDG